MAPRSVPGLSTDAASTTIDALASRLTGLIDLQLVLKHVHWNVVGTNFVAVHEMLDTHVDAVREMTDAVAERIAILGGVPNGNSGNVVATRDWDDYPVGRANVQRHLAALDDVYAGVIGDHRGAIETVGDVDPITEDLLIGQTADLEMQQWFVRSHLDTGDDLDHELQKITAAGRG
ncbi:MAG: DNA starvation/stationary phase protection protein Dps [Acidimicrobiales bacterium]